MSIPVYGIQHSPRRSNIIDPVTQELKPNAKLEAAVRRLDPVSIKFRDCPHHGIVPFLDCGDSRTTMVLLCLECAGDAWVAFLEAALGIPSP